MIIQLARIEFESKDELKGYARWDASLLKYIASVILFYQENSEEFTVDSSNPVEQLAKRLSTLLPGSVDTVRKDIENNLRSGIESGLRTMNLVSREEFEVQTAVLLRTREKLEALEKLVAELEAKVGR